MAIGAETMTHRSDSTPDFDVQTPIHSKYIPDPEQLRAILRGQFGTDKFEVEMRHDTYTIKSETVLNADTIKKIRELSNIITKEPAIEFSLGA
ncbi:hypothetical protein F4814DRAFT_426221 [Daldinia grandis]|nr:hypothetical protein F4814DRAFT_426221 [Daldinia grandis]